jgi:hypothetical protein
MFTVIYIAQNSADSVESKTESVLSEVNSFEGDSDISPENFCKFTIVFMTSDGDELRDPYITYYKQGDNYRFVIPDIEGYDHSDTVLIGVIDGDYTREIIYVPTII